MNFFEANKKKAYFEGFYYRITGEINIALIPSIAIDKNGKKSALIQVNTEDKSHVFHFDYNEFFYNNKTHSIKIGDNVFSATQMKVNLQNAKFSFECNLQFSELKTLKSSIMGIFRFFPMKCRHEIISMRHKVIGNAAINGQEIAIKKSVGYLEKDRGTTFPQKYVWLACNDFPDESSLFLSIAEVETAKLKFTGLIAVFFYKDTEFRFATYNGGKIIYRNKNEIALKKGKHILKIEYKKDGGNRLLAPVCGEMTGEVFETLKGEINLEFFEKGKSLCKFFSKNCGIEEVE